MSNPKSCFVVDTEAFTINVSGHFIFSMWSVVSRLEGTKPDNSSFDVVNN